MKSPICAAQYLLLAMLVGTVSGQQFSFDPSLTQSRFFSDTISMDSSVHFSDGSGFSDHEAKPTLVQSYQDSSGSHDWGQGVSTFPIAIGDIAPAANGFATIDGDGTSQVHFRMSGEAS